MRETLVARMLRVRDEERLARLARRTGAPIDFLRAREAEERRAADEGRRLRVALEEMVPTMWGHPAARQTLERLVPRDAGARETADTLAKVLLQNAPALAREISRQVGTVAVAATPAAGAGEDAAAAPTPVRRIAVDDIQGIIDMLNEAQMRGQRMP